MSMRPGTKNGVGAALQTMGQGLMQFTQLNIEEQRQKNLEAIRQRERGEDKADRDSRYQTEDARYRESTDFQKERSAKEDEHWQRNLESQERGRKDAIGAAAAARQDAKEARAQEAYENIDRLYQDRLRDIEKAERDGTTTPEVVQQQRLQIARESSAKKEEFIRRHPFLKSFTIGDYVGGDQKAPAAGAAAATPATAATATPDKKPLPAGLMDPAAAQAANDPAARAVEASGLQPTESVGTTVKEGLASAGEAVASGAKAVKEGWSDANALADVKTVMNRLGKTGTIPIEEVRSIAESNVSEKELRSAGADERVIKIIRQIRSSQ